jgi:hypothetical protein
MWLVLGLLSVAFETRRQSVLNTRDWTQIMQTTNLKRITYL